MTSLPALFLNNLLPIFLAAAAGYLLARRFHMDPRPLSQVIFYIFSPCLLFALLTQSELSNGDILRMMAFAATNIILIGVLTWLAGKFINLPRQTLAAVMIATMFMNAGNFGLPATQFAFGETALAYASLYFVTDSMLSYSLGVV
ncbi:MAG TPA: AEC family transporter, partial [Anaerolineales bacterium]|nr:AEC family transporter [Anaerolineales bacterium]